MKRLLSLLALLLSAPVFAASDVTPVYPDLILQKNVTTVSTGSPQRTQPVAYQIVATGTGATVSATVKIYCKTINLSWASGTQQGSDITLSASNTDVDSSVTVTGACPYLYSDVTAISSTTVDVVATPMYSAASSTTNNAAGQYADDADFTDGTSVGVLSQGVAESASPTAVTEGDVGAAAITLNRAWKSSLYTPLGDSAMDDTANAVKVAGGSVSGACSNADVDTIETLCSITVTGYDKCTVVFTVATAVLSDFNVDLANDATTFATVATTATDYTAPQGHIYGASGDLTVAATSGTHFVEVDGLAGFDTLRLQAAGTSSAVTGTYRCSKQ